MTAQEQFDRDHRALLRQGRDGLRHRFAGDPNVTGFGVGYRIRGGERTNEPAVLALVAKKRPENHVARSRLLPSTVQVSGRTYGVDVIEAGPFSFAPPAGEDTLRVLGGDGWHTPVPITDKYRPATEGSGIANVEGFGTGTFGAVVRDRTDQKICLLSCNHVVANLNLGRVGQHIAQPGDNLDDANTVARLKRFVPLSFAAGSPGTVDAGIAEVIDESLVGKGIVQGLMPPISASHPAIGVLFAGDNHGNIFICDMQRTLDALNVDLLPSNAVAAARLDMNVEKVGRTTGHTANIVTGLDFSISVSTGGLPGVPPVVYMTGVHLINSFGWAGDSGSVVCAGGEANRPVYTLVDGCFLIPIVPDMYDLPATATTEFGDRLRDEFLALSRVGRLLVSVIYLNEDLVRSKTEGVEASSDEKYQANQLYTKYRDFLERALDNPDDPGTVLTDDDLTSAATAMLGVKLRTTPAQYAVAEALYKDVLVPAKGKNFRQMIDYLNDPEVYRTVYSRLATDPELILQAPIESH
ncbi:hypothetical protein AB0L70_14275 [Kribbella sp. NPDC051952]|uniref:hypothetical protein n=1 Tax=Kribbella sp. NPDC051952 TaxID=3154851 RepID=UPI003419599D